MPLSPTVADLALRLLLTVVACGIIGLDRGVRGHAAGLRTTILVGLAASSMMIEANLLLATGGHTEGSFANMDVLRLPLGILTGVGFIGAGTILRRGDLVIGITTAATLWAVTAIGTCFGGGAIGLGVAVTAISVATLVGLRWADLFMPRKQKAILVVRAGPQAIKAVGDLLRPLGYKARFFRVDQDERGEPGEGKLCFEVTWTQTDAAGPPLALIEGLTRSFKLVSFELSAELPS